MSAAFRSNPGEATARYRHKRVEVSGKVVDRNLESHTIVFETGLDNPQRIVATFTAARFDSVRDADELTIRGTCVGLQEKGFVGIENAERHTLIQQTTPDFLPLQAGRELLYEHLIPTRTKDNAITQVSLRFVEPDRILTTTLRIGSYPAATLFTNPRIEPIWNRTSTEPSGAPQLTLFRVHEGRIEFRTDQPPVWWDPVLKFGLKKGESWSVETPEKKTVTYTVGDFRKDESERLLVDVKRVVKNPKDANHWEESLSTYARGLGEIRRIVTKHSLTGKPVVVKELRLVESDQVPSVAPFPRELGPKGQ